MTARGRHVGTAGHPTTVIWLALLLMISPASPRPALAESDRDDRATGSWLSLTVDQMAVDQLELADMQIKSGSYVEVANTLQAILDAPDRWVSAGASGAEFVGAHEAANRRIAALPEAGREAYQRLVEPIAAGLLEQALATHDFDKLRETATRFAQTPSGRKARSACAALLRDRGWTATAETSLGTASGLDAPSTAPAEIPRADQLRQVRVSVPEWMRASLRVALDDAYENGRHPMLSVDAVQTNVGTVTATPFGTGARGTDVDWTEASVLVQPPAGSRDPGDLPRFAFQSARVTSLATDGERSCQLSLRRASSPGHQSLDAGDEVLVCRDAEGNTAWTADPASLGVRFLSPPTFGLDRIWMLAEERTAPRVALMSFDPVTGEVLGRNVLGEALRSWEQDTPRQRHAARVTIDRDAILCLTVAGAVVAVEPLSGERLWAYRYPRSDAPQQPREPGQPAVESVEWSTPRRAHAVASAQRLVFISPDTDMIHVLDRATGRPIRQLPSRPADRLLRLDEKELLVEAVDSIRTVDLTSGEIVWSSSLSWPAGRGVLTGATYIYPAQDGTLRTVRPGTPQAAESGEWRIHEMDASERLSPPRPGELVSLLHVGDEWLMLSARVAANDESANDEPLPTAKTAELKALAERFEQSLSEASWPQAASAWAELMQRSPERWFLEFSGELQSARLDRWLQGRLKAARSDLAPDERAVCDDAFHAAYKRLRDASADPLATLWDRCGEFPWVWEDRLSNLPAAGDAVPIQVQLLRQVHLAEGALQAATMVQLAQRHADRGGWQAADHWLKRLSQLGKPGGSDALASSLKKEEALTELRNRVGAQLADRRTWSKNSVPVLAQQERLSTDIIRTTVPIQSSPGLAWQRLTAELGWPGGRELHLARSEWRQPLRIELPAADNAYRTDSSMVRACSIGDLLVLQAGAEVFGIAPYSPQGTPLGSLIWTRESPRSVRSGRDSDQSVNLPPGEAGFRRSHQAEVTRNLFGMPAGVLGPAGPGYVLLRQHGQLIALDPATGAELWRRCDVPAECSLFGNAEFVVALASSPLEGPVVDVIDAVDGRLLRRSAATIEASSIRQAVGTRILVHTGKPTDESEPMPLQRIVDPQPVPLSLQLVELVDQNTVWQREWEAGALAFEIDSERFGVAAPGDRLEVVDLPTGETLSTTEVALPKPLRAAACSVTEDAMLIAVSGPGSDQHMPRGYQRESTRRIDLNGKLIACNPQGSKILWQRELKDTSWPLDQPPDLPVIVISELHSQGDYAPMSSRLRVLDKRTGEQLLQEEQSNRALMNVVVTGQLARRVVRLRTQYRIIEFRYEVRHHP